MTRLCSTDVQPIPAALPEYDQLLRSQTGHSLLELAQMAAGVPVLSTDSSMAELRAAVVPLTSGQGIIPGFSMAVKSIVEFLGITAWVTQQDQLGWKEALKQKANIILSADDHGFTAFIPTTGQTVDNSAATGKAFAMALNCAAGGVAGREVWLIGLGPVGLSAGTLLHKLGARIVVSELIPERIKRARAFFPLSLLPAREQERGIPALILDASPASDSIPEGLIHERTIVAAPGLPLGIPEQAIARLGKTRLIHDALSLGVATMAMESAALIINGIKRDCGLASRSLAFSQ